MAKGGVRRWMLQVYTIGRHALKQNEGLKVATRKSLKMMASSSKENKAKLVVSSEKLINRTEELYYERLPEHLKEPGVIAAGGGDSYGLCSFTGGTIMPSTRKCASHVNNCKVDADGGAKNDNKGNEKQGSESNSRLSRMYGDSTKRFPRVRENDLKSIVLYKRYKAKK